MIQHYPSNKFMPSQSTIDIIRQFAYNYRPIVSNGKCIPFFLN